MFHGPHMTHDIYVDGEYHILHLMFKLISTLPVFLYFGIYRTWKLRFNTSIKSNETI